MAWFFFYLKWIMKCDFGFFWIRGAQPGDGWKQEGLSKRWGLEGYVKKLKVANIFACTVR